MDDTYEQAREGLRRAVVACGFPEEFASALAMGLGSENAIRHMTSYLWGVRPTSMEDVADELVAIVDVRDRWIERKVSERAQASLTAFYNRPREDEE